MIENFQPPRHIPPGTLWGSLQFFLRTVVDFQVHTVYRSVRGFLADMRGGIVADIGCGESPYRHLFDRHGLTYMGLDTVDADLFSYRNPRVTHFDGMHIPLAEASVDGFLCTEVIEHLEDPAPLIAEMRRILKPGAQGLVTVPWSARYHYIPHDYCRYTPAKLQILFRDFSSVRIEPRGTDITVIASKAIAAFGRHVMRACGGNLLAVPFAIVLLPFAALAVPVGHLALSIGAGSEDDPLGYTVWLTK